MGVLGDRGEPLNRLHLAVQTNGDLALQRDLLNLFMVQAADFVGHLHALAEADPSAACDLAHKMNGSARAIGAFELAAAADEFESALTLGDGVAAFEPLTAALDRALDAVEAYLRDLPPHHGA
jgi:HPt (histidine-containing phosphotransfer) domain-containing protein